MTILGAMESRLEVAAREMLGAQGYTRDVAAAYETVYAHINEMCEHLRETGGGHWTRRYDELDAMSVEDMKELCISRGIRLGSLNARWPRYRMTEMIVADERRQAAGLDALPAL